MQHLTHECPSCNLIVILGPTATGKTQLGVSLARLVNGEIISADSRQVFRKMDIGTGKDLETYGDIPFHLINILDPGDEFNLFSFQRMFFSAFQTITEKGHFPILVGGTGLYLDSVLRGYRMSEVPPDKKLREELALLPEDSLRERLLLLNPCLHNTTDLGDRDRLLRAIEIATRSQSNDTEEVQMFPELHPMVFGIHFERDLLRKRITARLKARLSEGLIEEVAELLATGVPAERLDAYGLEYRYVTRYLKGELNRNDMYQKLNAAIHDFAKKQETWFRRMEKQGVSIIWLDGNREPLRQLLHEISLRENQ